MGHLQYYALQKYSTTSEFEINLQFVYFTIYINIKISKLRDNIHQSYEKLTLIFPQYDTFTRLDVGY